jgi:hypothetical protein
MKPGRKARVMARPVVGAQTEQEGRTGLVLFQDFNQAWHAFTGAAVGVDVDLQCQFGHVLIIGRRGSSGHRR